MTTPTPIKKILQFTAINDTWGGWENNTDYEVSGESGNDQLYGYHGNDTLRGDEGDDSIYGGLGNDSLLGGSGQDKLFGGEGNDDIDGGADNDEAFGGLGNDNIKGGSGNDSLFGDDGQDSLEGNEGNDSLFGEGGRDHLSGNEGDDALYGGADDDVLTGDDGADALYGGDGQDSLKGGAHQDSLYGGTDHDLLTGGAGNDALYGEAGDDILIGIESSTANATDQGINTVDVYVGGAGRDLFVLGNVTHFFYDDGDASTVGASDYALLKDFNRFEDTIRLKGTAGDYVVAALPTAIANEFSQMYTAGLYRDTDGSGTWGNTDELIAVVEHLSPESLVLTGNYFQYTDGPAPSNWHPINDSQWEMVFSDEFDLTSLNANKWNTRYSHNIYEGRTNPWNGEHQAYVGDNEIINGVTYDAFEFNNGVLNVKGVVG